MAVRAGVDEDGGSVGLPVGVQVGAPHLRDD